MLLLVAVASVFSGIATWYLRELPPVYRTLDEILALENFRGYDLFQAPDQPGPYVFRAACVCPPGSQSSVLLKSRGVLRTVPAPDIPGFEIEMVVLETRDGDATLLIPKREAP